MQASAELIKERSKPVGSDLVISASVDLSSGATSDVLQSNSAITMSLKPVPSPSPVDSSMMGSEFDDADNPNAGIEQALQSFVSKEIQERIQKILEEVQQLSDTEKLLLYLRLPGESASDSKDDFDQSQALPISTTRAEQTQAFHWIRCHLEECDNSSTLPKHEVYDEYKAHCESMNAARTLSAPDFGKIIKCVFPRVKARRLGTRGNSKYCYSGIQRKKNVKPPTLPPLQVPSASEKEKNTMNSGNGLSGGEKIEADQTLSAACLLVCEWANKLLGRVFSTLIELARFLVGGSYVSSKSMAAFVVMSSNDINTPQLTHSITTLMTPLKQVEEQMLLTQKRRQTQQQQLQKKMPPRQQQKQIHQIPANAMLQQGQPLCNTQQQLITHKALGPISTQQKSLHKQPLHIQPKPIQPSLQSPPPQMGQYYQQQTTGNPTTPPSGFPNKIRPVTPSMISPTTQIQSMPQTPSPFQSSPKFNAPGTSQNRPVTPSSATATPRHTPNSSEPTRFLFTPIPNGASEQRITRGESSPPTLRPTATHPNQLMNGEWSPQVGSSHPGSNDVPMSPSKQPRLINQNAPSTPTSNRRPGQFAYPLLSPRTHQRPLSTQQYVTSPTMPSAGCGRQLNPVSPSVGQRGQEFMLPPMITSVESLAGQQHCALITSSQASFSQGVNISSASVSVGDVHMSQLSKQGGLGSVPKSCRYSSGSDSGGQVQQTASMVQHGTMDYSAELETICNQASNSTGQMPPPAFQRSQSVPPLPQHTLAEQRFHPLTPQTGSRTLHLTPSPMDTSSNHHINGLKELRNRVLHGDVNNNGSRPPTDTALSARRNLTRILNASAEQSNMNSTNWVVSHVRTNQPVGGGDDHEMTVIENNLNFADLSGENDEALVELNTLDDAVFRDICNNTSGVWPTGDMNPWQSSQALEIMD